MNNQGWGNSWNNQWNDQMMNPEYLPDRVSQAQFSEPNVSPTQHYVQRNISHQIVPHVHPSHLTTINRQNIHHQHHFPHTQSVKNECRETHTMCGHPFKPHHGRCW